MPKPIYYLDWWDSYSVTEKSFLEVNYKPLFLDLRG